jgi:hypothetical protein
VERHRTGGMTAIAVLNIGSGGLAILNGLLGLLASFLLMFELLRMGAFDIPIARLAFSLLIIVTGSVGLVAGIGIYGLRPWARPLSLVYGALLILSCVISLFIVPIIASIGTYDLSSLTTYGVVRLILFSVTYVVFPVVYSILLCIVFHKPAWKTAFALGRPA